MTTGRLPRGRARRGAVGERPVRPGGQALIDGVFMRTDRAWAIARADGTVAVGQFAPPPMGDVPVGRVLGGLAAAMRVGVGRGLLGSTDRGGDRRRVRRLLLVALVGGEAAVILTGWAPGWLGLPDWASAVAAVLSVLAGLAVVRAVLPAPLWRYHGAEHKAVAAFEQGVDLADVDAVMACSRVHNRCGTNLVVLLAVVGGLLERYALVAQIPLFVLAIGVGAEVVGAAARRPGRRWSVAVLAGGRLLQRYVTTAEPTPAEQAVACRALTACLTEHAALTGTAHSGGSAAPPSAPNCLQNEVGRVRVS